MNLEQLQLDRVQALLAQAGQSLPESAGKTDVAFIQSLLDALCELSSRDPLTGLLNRRHFMLSLEREIDRVARAGEPALLLMVDIDHFKGINDTHGHVVGDAAIRAVARVLGDCVRPMDTVARYGGEEFALIFPNCPPAFARVVAERIRQSVEATPVELPGGQVLRLTVSCGGAFAPAWIRSHALAWIERADAQMYLAKAAGRNRVNLEEQPESTVSAEEKRFLFEWKPEPGDMMGAEPST